MASSTMRSLTPLLRQSRTPFPSFTNAHHHHNHHHLRLSSTFSSRPSPIKLPPDQQAEFERLQRAAAVSSAFQDSASPPATETLRHATSASSSSSSSSPATVTAAAGKTDDAVNQGLFRGAPPEFDGDTNPRTGEVGGPKNEPLRWGGEGDWSYNGRVTDF